MWLAFALPLALGDLLARREGVAVREGSCSCDCCAVGQRLPSEVVNGFDLKCSLKPQEVGVCAVAIGDTCSNLSPSRVITTSTSLDYARFCFFECKVPQGMNSELGSTCAELTDQETQIVKSQSVAGNAVDLASAGIGQVAEESATTADVGAAEPTAAAAPIEEAEAAPAEPEGKELAKASQDAAEAARTEARATSAEAKAAAAAVNAASEAAKAHKAAEDGAHAVASLRGNLVQAKLHARAAKAAAEETRKVLEELHTVAHAAAVEVGRQAAAEVQAEADDAKRQLASMIAVASVPPPPEVPEAVGKVMGPYLSGQLHAMGIKAAYSDQAQIWAGDAGQMRQQARQMGDMANDYQAAGNTDAAQKLLSDANGLFAKADSMAAKTNEYQAIASKINDGLPAYTDAMNKASQRAAYWANLPGMVPPPVALTQTPVHA